MNIIEVPPICTTVLITPAHRDGRDKSQGNDADDDHDYDDSCPYGYLAHFGVLFPRIMRRRRYRGLKPQGEPLAPCASAARERRAFEPGERIWIGVDVGGERSHTAVVWISEALQVGCAIFEGEEGVLRAAERVRELAVTYTVTSASTTPGASGRRPSNSNARA